MKTSKQNIFQFPSFDSSASTSKGTLSRSLWRRVTSSWRELRLPGLSTKDSRMLLDYLREGTQSALTLGVSVSLPRIGREKKVRLQQRVTVAEVEQERDRAEELFLLLTASQAITSQLTMKPLLGTILEQFKSVLGHNGAAIFTLEADEADQCTLLNYQGLSSPGQLKRLFLHLKQGPAYARIQDLQEVVIGDGLLAYESYADSRSRRSGGPLKRAEDTFPSCSWMAIPLSVDTRLIGIMLLQHDEPGFYRQQHVDLALALAHQSAIALENARRYEEIKELAAVQERKRLALELHDSVLQSVYSINLHAHSAHEALKTDPEQASDSIKHVMTLTMTGLAEIRALLFNLRPELLEMEGLVSALKKRVALLHTHHQLNITVISCTEPDISIEKKYALYRIAQEALNNVIKHAHATTATVKLAQEGQDLLLEVSDNGCGFEPDKAFSGHLGLYSMHERVENFRGTLIIKSAPDQGTLIRAQLSD